MQGVGMSNAAGLKPCGGEIKYLAVGNPFLRVMQSRFFVTALMAMKDIL